MKAVYNILTLFLLYTSTAGAQPFVYITNAGNDNLSVVNSQTNDVITTIATGDRPQGITVSHDSKSVYVINSGNESLSEISTAANTILGTFPLDNINTTTRLVESTDGQLSTSFECSCRGT